MLERKRSVFLAEYNGVVSERKFYATADVDRLATMEHDHLTIGGALLHGLERLVKLVGEGQGDVGRPIPFGR